ncbi:TetR family transcriptional regulator [Paenibacillus albilobatus]|uniref:TetR family transcriptional regulator n=1 Tax=Paenibacillus albilobatus TaxID=2716884 RepID=A0A919XB84_9BACL|nr:helix-turn-helix domain-containing protein [Paenibacillus albilobatus]GIO29451.1 TetR family transcriptional regulator [Paenibacillus albilobatus]
MNQLNSKTRWDREREEAKQQRVSLMLEAAQRVFNRKGLDKATMQDVATEAHMGVATVFRHFPKKDKLIVAVATKIIDSQTETFEEILHRPGTCYERLEQMLDVFIGFVGDHHSENTKLIEAFESYAAQSREPLEDLPVYSAAVGRIQSSLSQILKDGVNDGSLRSDLPLEETIATVTNAFGQFAKKLSLQNSIPMLQPNIEPVKQLEILKSMILSYLKAT